MSDADGPKGHCENSSGTLRITTSGSTARVTWSGERSATDNNGSFDAATCTVAHASPGYSDGEATVSVRVTYSLVVGADGALNGTATVDLDGGLLTGSCRRNYTVSGSKKMQ